MMELVLRARTGRLFMDESAQQVTQILAAAEVGDPQAAEQLLPLVYEEPRRSRLTEPRLNSTPSPITTRALRGTSA